MSRADDRIEADRARRDRAGVGPSARTSVRLVPLKELDSWKIAEGEPDVRGWEVRTVSGRDIGEIDDVLVDPEAREVVMLDIDLRGTDRHTLAPIRAVQLDRARRVAIIDSADLRDADDIPALRRNAPPTDEEARHFGQRYERAYGERGWDRDREFRVRCPDGELCFEGERERAVEHEAERSAERSQARAEAGAAAASSAAAPQAREGEWTKRRGAPPRGAAGGEEGADYQRPPGPLG